MSDRTIAKRYASALFGEAGSADIVDSVDDDVELLHESLKDSRELRLFFASPVISEDKKMAVIRRLFASHVCDLTLDFLQFVVTKQREGIIESIVDEYRSMRLRHKGIVEARARVAIPMGESDIEDLRASIAKSVGSEIRLNVETDPQLVGGVVVQIGDRVYDGSLKRKLAMLQKQMQGGSFQTN
ncbi:MAG: ATP synthase F1 subunit delta [Candidatus Latescibacterota bacterium]|jgi:F-type H+-transporting ATPase subunit delta